MPGSKGRRRDVSLKLAAVVIGMIAVSFLAGERVGVALASRGNHVAVASSPGLAQGPEGAAPPLASGSMDAPGVGADCNTNYK